MAATNPYEAPKAGATNDSATFKIFLASFLTLIAAGIGFAIRGAILEEWASQFGFTMFELGTITGGGLVGFGLVIIAASFFVDKVGYKPILFLAFLCHLGSAALTLAATPIFQSSGKAATYDCLYYGMFLFAIGNGLCEAVINPLVATLYPTKKTHYLNILHAGWPAGLIIGALLAKCFVGNAADVWIMKLRWEIPMALFLIPTLLYGILVAVNKFPRSEATAAGVSIGEMLAQFAAPLLLFLLFLHACVGYVELGTDSWISTITDMIAAAAGSAGQGLLLFIYASTVMFILRFFAGPIVERINPLGLLFVSACLGSAGLYLIGKSEGIGMLWGAMTVYAIGKTFLWPTMLGVVGERFPRGGAIVMGAMGGIGMLSAGYLGGPGIGYKQDYYASQELQKLSPETYNRYKADGKNKFLFFPEVEGLNGQKVAVFKDAVPGSTLQDAYDKIEKAGGLTEKKNSDVVDLEKWWLTAKPFEATDKKFVDESKLYGSRMALIWTAAVPATMAVGYLLLILYFRATGGYKQEHLHTLTGDATPNEY
jgi:MFS family permease